MGEVMECLFMKFSNGNKFGAVNTFQDGAAIQRDLGGLDGWDQQEPYEIQQWHAWVMHKVMHLRKRKYLQPYGLGSSFPEKPPGDMVHSELNMSHQYALAAKKDPGLY